MGADLIAVTYVALPLPDGATEYPVKEAEEALKRLVFGLPEDTLNDLMDGLYLGETDDDNEARDSLLQHLNIGLSDYIQSRTSGHRYHTEITQGPDGLYFIGLAGGTSFGDDPYDDWSAFVALLDIIQFGDASLVRTLALDPRVRDYLNSLGEVVH